MISNRASGYPSAQPQHGFALLAVLWIIIGISVLVMTIDRVTNHTFTVIQGEHDRLAGRWIAEGCIERLRATMGDSMRVGGERARDLWRNADRMFLAGNLPALRGCELTMETDGRIVLGRASEAELDSLPGMTPEAVAKLLQFEVTDHVQDAAVIEPQLSPEAKVVLDAHLPEFLRQVTIEPDAWRIRARAHIGTSIAPVHIDAWLTRGGANLPLIRWVEW